MSKKRSLKRQIFIFAIIISATILFSGLGVIFLIQQYTKNDMNEHMEAVMNSINDELTDVIELPLQLFGHVDSFLEKHHSLDSEEVSDYLRTIQESYDYFTDVHIINHKGIVINTGDSDKSVIGSSVIYEPFYQENFAEGTMSWSKIYISEVQQPTISVTIPKNDYLIVVDLNLSSLMQRIDRKGIYNELEELHILDQYGTYIVTNEYEKIEGRFQYPNFDVLKNNLDSSTQYFDSKNLIGIKLIEDMNWYILFNFDDSNLYSSISELTVIFLVVWLVFSVFLIRSVYRNLKRVNKDIDYLKKRTSHLKDGNYLENENESENENEVKLTFSEMIELNDNFSVMKIKIQTREEEIIGINAGLEKRIEDRTLELQEINALLEEEIQEKEHYELELNIINKNLDGEVSKRTKELEILNRELKNTTDKAIEANEAKSKFLSIMSHEMRTPLNGIIGFIQMLDFEELTDEQLEIFELINNSSHILLSLINDLLDLSKYESKKMVFETIPFSLERVIESCIATFKPMAEVKQLQLITDAITCNDRLVIGDPTKITQLLYNLLNNSIKFTHQGYVHFDVKVDCEDSSCKIKLEIKDTGIGIKDEIKEKLFKPFVQADASINRNFGGSGLGLIICKEIVEHYAGTIDFESEYMKGTMFTVEFSLPMNMVSQLDIISESDCQRPISNKVNNVLIVEDNVINQKVMIKYLTKQKIDFTLANNGSEAVDLCRTEQFELIFMDCQMPVMDGFEATSKLRHTLEIQTPIIAMTAFTSDEDKKRCYQVGMNGFLTKPIDFNELARWLGISHKSKNQIVKENDVLSISPIVKKNMIYDTFAKELVKSLDFDYDTCLDLIITFVDQGKLFFDDMEKYYVNQDYLSLAKKLHQFKGAAGALRFEIIAQEITQAEDLVRNNFTSEAISKINHLKDHVIFKE